MTVVVALLVGVAVGFAVASLAYHSSRLPSAWAPTDMPPPTAPSLTADLPVEPGPMEQLLAEVVDCVDRAIIVVDPKGAVVLRNSAATALSGTHVGVLLGSAVDDAARDCGQVERVERRVDLHGPPRISLLVVGERLADGGVVVVVEDVSERSRIDAMRTDFVANISHELKTPVGAISVLADALIGEDDPAVVHRVANRITEESERAVTTIDDLLELARIETSRPVEEIIDLDDVVHGAIARGRSVDEGKGVQLTAIDAGPSLQIRGDSRQITSALGNLVENAVKYSDPEGLVQVRTRYDDRWLEVLVADQGVGIPARDIDRVFERFYRVDRARSRETGGTGLGLSIVRHVATIHGGDVQVSSTEGEGSTFVLRLPASVIVADVGNLAERAGAGGSSGTTRVSEGM